jgi:hypothetical protein
MLWTAVNYIRLIFDSYYMGLLVYCIKQVITDPNHNSITKYEKKKQNALYIKKPCLAYI